MDILGARSRTPMKSDVQRYLLNLQTAAGLSAVVLVANIVNGILTLNAHSTQGVNMIVMWLVTIAFSAWAAVEGIVAALRKPSTLTRWLAAILATQSLLVILKRSLAQPLLSHDSESSKLAFQVTFESAKNVHMGQVALGAGFAITFIMINFLVMRALASEYSDKAARVESQMMDGLNSLSLTRDNETGNHILRTQHYVRLLANRLRASGGEYAQLTERYIDNLFRAAPLHDIGKVGIPDHILLKPGKLTQDEWRLMQTHASIGEAVLQSAEGHRGSNDEVLSLAIAIAGGHHEKWDGTGYPRAKKGTEIPLPARIMAIADVYDALTNSRVYKRAWTHDEAVAEIAKGKGTQFDPDLIEAFKAEAASFRTIALDLRDDPSKAQKAVNDIMPRFTLRSLSKAEERFKILFERLPVGMAMIDHESGQFIHVNESLLESTGYEKEELLALTFWDITPRKYLEQEARQARQLESTGRFGPNFKEYIRKNGTCYPIKLSGFILTEDDGQKLVWGIIEDLSKEAHAGGTAPQLDAAPPRLVATQG